MSDKRKYKERQEKLGINQQNRFQTSGRGGLLNLTKVRITTKGNGSMNMNIVHTSCFQNKNYTLNKTYPTFFMPSFKFS